MTSDDALLWAREQYQRRTFSHLIPELAEAYRYGHAAGQSEAEARVAQLEAALREAESRDQSPWRPAVYVALLQ